MSIDRHIISGILCILSAFFLFATLIVYAILPELRDPQGKILMCAMSPLLGAYLLLAVMQLNPAEEPTEESTEDSGNTICICLGKRCVKSRLGILIVCTYEYRICMHIS